MKLKCPRQNVDFVFTGLPLLGCTGSGTLLADLVWGYSLSWCNNYIRFLFCFSFVLFLPFSLLLQITGLGLLTALNFICCQRSWDLRGKHPQPCVIRVFLPPLQLEAALSWRDALPSLLIFKTYWKVTGQCMASNEKKWRNNFFLLHVIYKSIMSELLQLTELDLEEKRQALSLTNVSN